MRCTNSRLVRRWDKWAVGLGALLCVPGIGCLSDPGPAKQIQREQGAALSAAPAPLSALAAPAAPSRLALSPQSSWQRLDAPGGWALSPRFVDDALVLLSGKLGRGLFLAEDRGAVHVIDPGYRGPVELLGRVICLPNRATVTDPPAMPGGLQVAGAGTCPSAGFNPELGQVLHESDVGRWSLHPRRGELVFTPMGEDPVLVEDRVPFSIRVSPDGRRAAYVLGKLTSPTLILWDADQGRRVLGAGVYPVFHPDGLLIFGRPDGRRLLGSITSVARSELRAHDLTTHESWDLTNTPDLAEMEPALSPDGSRLVFSDWRGGGAYLVTLIGVTSNQGVTP